MKLAKHFFIWGVFINSIFTFLIGCNVNSTVPVLSSREANVQLTTPVPSRMQLSPVSITPIEPLISPTFPTKTPTLLPPEEPTTETTYIFPPLTVEEIELLYLGMSENNRGCLFPCFWGIVPGETEWQLVEPYLASFANTISFRNSDGTFSDVPLDNSFIAWVYLYLPKISQAPFEYAFGVQDGIITFIDAPMASIPNNTLPTILDIYGQPSEVWLLTANAPMDDSLGFSLTLFYAQDNFMLTYRGQGTVIDEKVRGCLSEQEESLKLIAWSPDKELPFTEAINGLHSPRPIRYERPLGEATEMSIDTFYEKFKNANGPICLETPTELWPGP